MNLKLGKPQDNSRVEELKRNESPTTSTVSTDTEFSAHSLAPCALSQGILKSASATSASIRIDRDGNVIIAGSKSHRVSFADEVDRSPRPIAKVHKVESLKSFNFGNRFVEGENGCVCTIC